MLFYKIAEWEFDDLIAKSISLICSIDLIFNLIPSGGKVHGGAPLWQELRLK